MTRSVKISAEKAAKEILPQEDGGAWKRIVWLWGLTGLAVLGVFLDLFRRHFTPLGVIGGLSPLAVFAWKERHTALGRQAKFSLLVLLAFWVTMQIIWNSLEAIFIAAIVTVVCYLGWDRLRAWWTKPKAAAPEPPPAAEGK